MKSTINMICFLIFSAGSIAHADSYLCRAKANPDRGFGMDMDVQVTKTSVGGSIVILAMGKQRTVAQISQVALLKKNDPITKQAFVLTLGLIHEPDVSGVASNDLGKIDSITLYKGLSPDGANEFIIFRIYNGSQQIGGTLLVSVHGTVCLPIQ